MMCTTVIIAYAYIHACSRSGRHLVVFERDSAIFYTILAPLCDSLPPPIVHGLQSINMTCKDDVEPIWKVSAQSPHP